MGFQKRVVFSFCAAALRASVAHMARNPSKQATRKQTRLQSGVARGKCPAETECHCKGGTALGRTHANTHRDEWMHSICMPANNSHLANPCNANTTHTDVSD